MKKMHQQSPVIYLEIWNTVVFKMCGGKNMPGNAFVRRFLLAARFRYPMTRNLVSFGTGREASGLSSDCLLSPTKYVFVGNAHYMRNSI